MQGDQLARQITVALHIPEAKDQTGSLEATPDTGAEATFSGILHTRPVKISRQKFTFSVRRKLNCCQRA